MRGGGEVGTQLVAERKGFIRCQNERERSLCRSPRLQNQRDCEPSSLRASDDGRLHESEVVLA